MKTTIKEHKQEKPFPKLMITKDNKKIVLMSDVRQGTVIVSGSYTQPVGYFSKMWLMQDFKDFHGTITLEND